MTPAFFASIRMPLYRGGQPPISALNAIEVAWDKHGTGNLEHEAYVLATIYNEVGPTLQPKPENLFYSATRLMQVWPSRFKTVAQAQPYAGNPEKLADFVYAGILGNGPPESGDGWKYRGHGYQTTGRQHFTTFSTILGIDLVNHPELLDQSVEAAAAALIVGMVKGIYTGASLSTYIDGKDEPDAEELREFINARRVVNGTFNAQAIGNYAVSFKHALQAK